MQIWSSNHLSIYYLEEFQHKRGVAMGAVHARQRSPIADVSLSTSSAYDASHWGRLSSHEGGENMRPVTAKEIGDDTPA